MALFGKKKEEEDVKEIKKMVEGKKEPEKIRNLRRLVLEPAQALRVLFSSI